jgi:hypothetical protein
VRRSDKTTDGRGRSSGALPSREDRAATRPSVSLSLALEAAINAAEFANREPNDDGYRVAVFCNSLGGAFIFDLDEVKRRVLKHFPRASDDEAVMASRYLENRMKLFMKPTVYADRQRGSWVHGWT